MQLNRIALPADSNIASQEAYPFFTTPSGQLQHIVSAFLGSVFFKGQTEGLHTRCKNRVRLFRRVTRCIRLLPLILICERYFLGLLWIHSQISLSDERQNMVAESLHPAHDSPALDQQNRCVRTPKSSRQLRMFDLLERGGGEGGRQPREVLKPGDSSPGYTNEFSSYLSLSPTRYSNQPNLAANG
jgi:hypothetical protein